MQNEQQCPHCKGKKIVNGNRCVLCSGFGLVDAIIANRYEVAKALKERKEQGILDFTPRVDPEYDLPF